MKIYDHLRPILQVLLRPIEDYLGVFGHGLLGDLVIAREEERNSLLRMELGRFLVADLIPTDDEYIFKLSARAPVADTEEWETEHTIVFKSTGKVVANSGKSETKKSDGNDTGKMDTKNETVGEKGERLLLDEVHMRWKLERYVFKRSVRFDTALEDEEKESDAWETDMEENDGTEVSTPVAGTGVTTVDAFSKASMLTLLSSALLVCFY